jgi:RecG-like helicase
MHPLNCEDRKAEGTTELYKTGNERTCTIFVATAVLEVGLNIPDLKVIVIFPGT